MYLRINAFALSGRQCYGKFIPQGVASLALGWALLPFQGVHYQIPKALPWPWNSLGLQPAQVKTEESI